MKSVNTHLKIGTLVYTVSKSWEKTKNEGAKVIPCRVVGYQNISNKIYPILERRGYHHKEIDPILNHLFTDLDEAVDKIKTKR